jgi:hypothetical protein
LLLSYRGYDCQVPIARDKQPSDVTVTFQVGQHLPGFVEREDPINEWPAASAG